MNEQDTLFAVDALLTKDQQRYLSGPIVQHRGGDAPQNLCALVPAARALNLAGGGQVASDLEALLYLSSASLVQPLEADDAHLMEFLMQQCQSLLGFTGTVHKMLGDAQPYTLSPWQQDVLLQLKSHIYQSVIKHAKKGETHG